MKTLNKQEAIESLRKGFKLKHTYFTDEEFIYQKGHYYITEEGYQIDIETFWKLRNSEGFNTGWYICNDCEEYINEEFEQLKKDIEPYLNTLVLCDEKLYVLTGIEEGNEDYYYVLTNRDGIYKTSFVGGVLYLKDKLNSKEYERLVYIHNMNYTLKVN